MHETIKPNVTSDWGKVWWGHTSFSGNACYPTDGRETIWDPYERLVPTATVGDYLDAQRAAEGQPTQRYFEAVPEDLAAYLGQRVLTDIEFPFLDPSTKIDRFGRVEKKTPQA